MGDYNTMKDQLETIRLDGEEQISKASTLAALQDVKAALFGKSGSITAVLKEIPLLEASMRAEIGRAGLRFAAFSVGIGRRRRFIAIAQ